VREIDLACGKQRLKSVVRPEIYLQTKPTRVIDGIDLGGG